MSTFERVEPETDKQKQQLERARMEDFEEVWIERPRKGGTLWMGEEEADEVTELIVDEADQSGRLRSIIDAVKSHRVSDDFSPRWSYAREDFERKLYSKRSKVRVSFVELKDTLYDVLKPHVREIVVCNPRRNALLKEGSKSDKIDARKLPNCCAPACCARSTTEKMGCRRCGSWHVVI